MDVPLVSIIMPVYNAAGTLRVSLSSLKMQTYDRLELLLVDDGSSDNSLNLLNEFKDELVNSASRIQVKVLSNVENRGVATTRNRGLEEASGEYIYYVDADDWLEHDAIAKMVEIGKASNSDIVGANWWLAFEKNEKYMSQPFFETAGEALFLMMTGRMRWNLWLFLVKRDLYVKHGITFVEGMNMGEDMLVMFKLFARAGKVVYLDEGLYHYGQSNEESLTKTYTEEHRKQVTNNIKEIKKYLVGTAYKSLAERWLDCLKLNVKLPLLVTGDKADVAIWREWFPEVNKMFFGRKVMPRRLSYLQMAANYKHMYWLIRLHYVAVVKLYYGILYK